MTELTLDKRKLAKGFGKAAVNYNQHAVVQHEIAEYGLNLLKDMSNSDYEGVKKDTHKGVKKDTHNKFKKDIHNTHLKKLVSNVIQGKQKSSYEKSFMGKQCSYKRIVDLGCGPASYSQSLAHLTHQLLFVDLSLEMLKQAAKNFDNTLSQSMMINADIENLPFRDKSIDCVFSSMAMQWCKSPKQAFEEIYRVLKPKGHAILCILTGESFGRLRQAWTSIDKPIRTNEFILQNEWISAVKKFDWKVNEHGKWFTTEHKNILSMLNSFKQIGANTLIKKSNQREFLGKSELASLHQYVSALCADISNQVCLDYHVSFIQIQKI